MHADYGLDAPGAVRGFALAGGVCAVGAAAAGVAGVGDVTAVLVLGALMFIVAVALMVGSSRRGKLHEIQRMLDGLDLRGNEEVLDVGCGRGALLIAAARRVPRGRAVGVDVWADPHGGGSAPAVALQNARAEDVDDRVVVVEGDTRELPFPDASFDVVVSSIALHSLEARDDRERACEEIARVLRPGGRVALLDFRGTHDCALALEDAGLGGVSRSGLRLSMYPPVRLVTARKLPGAVA